MCQNSIVQPLLTDLYQITMAYSYWKAGKTNERATFDLFFRKNPFQGGFTIFAGLEECLKFVQKFKYSDSDIIYLKDVLPESTDSRFFDYLKEITAKDVMIYAVEEGLVVFPRVPLLRVEGPLVTVQLLETTLLTLVNYATLMATNAARFRIVAGDNVSLQEFGLRRAQGPDGGLSASKYAYIGGFDATSNVLAGKLFNIPVKGTHAHAYITSFTGFEDLKNTKLSHRDTGDEFDMLQLSIKWRHELSKLLQIMESEANDGEMAAWISYAIAFPASFVALLDTYDIRKSGLLNFCAVALALNDLGYRASGVRLDSGDLAYLSKMCRHCFKIVAEAYKLPWFRDLVIVASNDINEDTIISLNEQGHSITSYGIGTHLVTCQRQPALGGVYKMVDIEGRPCMKLSEDVSKMTMPGRKDVYRLFGENGDALLDLIQCCGEPAPAVGEKVLCRHPFQGAKRAYVTPQRVEKLYKLYWKDGELTEVLPSLENIRQRVKRSLESLRNDHKRSLNPTPYKVSVSCNFFTFMHDLWLKNAPIGELA